MSTTDPTPQNAREARWRVGIDTGGTFTDLVAVGPGAPIAFKVPSTPDQPASAVLRAIEELQRRRPELSTERLAIVHGSTVATNSLLEGKSARVVLVTNQGFEDLIEIGRQQRRDLYSLQPQRPAPLVEREDRIGVPERTLANGERLASLSTDDLERLRREVQSRDPGAIAIGLLHAYANPDAEVEIEAALASMGLPISRSSAVAPLFREFERFSTTVTNAALLPAVRNYLEQLAGELGDHELTIMQSSGGLTSAREAARLPVRLVLSGPAGGIAAAEFHSKKVRPATGLVTFDMGGTSTDVGLVLGEARRTDLLHVDDRPLMVEAMDLTTIGAGGGSEVWIDTSGALRVGPKSQGADPGPACYGRGTVPCVTDAHMILGRLPVTEPLGGSICLQPGRSLAAFELLADTLDTDPWSVAAAVLEITDAAMERAVKSISLERGHDPRRLSLFAFGGAAGLHAARLATRLSMPQVVFPPHPGAASAFGMAVSAARIDVSQGVLRPLPQDGIDPELSRLGHELAEQAKTTLLNELGPGPVNVQLRVSCRYQGQSFELSVLFDEGVNRRFHEAHQQRYGFSLEHPLECVALHCTASRSPSAPNSTPPAEPANNPAIGTTEMVSIENGGKPARQEAPLLRRDRLSPGTWYPGPAIVLEPTATIVVEAGFEAGTDDTAMLYLRPQPSEPE